jgi:phosphate starvation-inducible PhoH-like protein
MTIVLEDQHTLTEVCGVNDANLKILERLLEEKVFSRGNEICILSEDTEKQELFRDIISRLEQHTMMGHLPCPDLIESVFQSEVVGSTEKADALERESITIPPSRNVFPKNFHQAQYIEAMHNHDIVFSIGPAGTGKTYLAIAAALASILSREKNKLILTRPVVEAGESLGYLPGDLAQKISPYLRPLYDAMDALISFDMIQKMEENRVIEIAPLAYMRGRSLQNSIIILDEAQNTTIAQMKMFLTRIGENSRAIITGDVTQIDLPQNKKSGLLHAVEILQPISGIHFSFFDGQDVIRNPLIKKIIEAYEKEEEKK